MHTATGQNRLVIVALAFDDKAAITGLVVDYGGVNITSYAWIDTGFSGEKANRVYYLVSPLTGSQLVTASWTGANTNVRMIVETFFGVNQADPLGSWTQAGNATSITSSNIDPLNRLCADFILTVAAGHVLTVGAGQKLRRTETPALDLRLSASTKPGAPNASMSWSSDISVYYGHVLLALHPVIPP